MNRIKKEIKKWVKLDLNLFFVLVFSYGFNNDNFFLCVSYFMLILADLCVL